MNRIHELHRLDTDDLGIPILETNRELVRREARANGWDIAARGLTKDSFARRGTVIDIWWTDRDTATVAVLRPRRVAYAGVETRADPNMAIVQVRGWLKVGQEGCR